MGLYLGGWLFKPFSLTTGPFAAGYSQGKVVTDDHSGVKGFELSRLHDERTHPTTVAKKGDASGRHRQTSKLLGAPTMSGQEP
jgi:hypothetical protein